MKFNKLKIAAADGAVFALAMVSASPATALGSASAKCSSVVGVNGNSSAQGSAQTWLQNTQNVCGELGVRIFYTTYPGSPTYYTAWSYGYTSVYRPNPGNTVLGANHLAKRGSNPDVTFSS